jgi:hypothetical protein
LSHWQKFVWFAWENSIQRCFLFLYNWVGTVSRNKVKLNL